MGGPASLPLPSQVAPSQTVDLSVNLTAPQNPGTYRGYWLLKNANGALFGIGSQANVAFWLEIRTSGVPSSSTGYDFAANACQATWTSGAGVLPCPGTPGSTNGFGLPVTNPLLENNTTDVRPAILMAPQNVYNGSVQATFPAFTVQNGDRFQSTIGCEFNAKGCYAVFRLDYQIGNGPITTFWSFGERYDGLNYQADVDLSPLAGQSVKFILSVNASGSPTDDRALWIGPRILRSGTTSSSILVAPTSGASSTPFPTAVNPTTTSSSSLPTMTASPLPPATLTPFPTLTSSGQPPATPSLTPFPVP